MILSYCYWCWSLLCCVYCRSLMLWKSTFWSCSKSTFLSVIGLPVVNFGPLRRKMSLSLYINHCSHLIWPKGHREPRNEAGSQSRADQSLRFESGSFRFWSWRAIRLCHSPLFKLSLLFVHVAHFFINNHNLNVSSAEKHCFVALNVKLQVNVRFKRLYWLLELSYASFVVKSTTRTVCFAPKSCIC